MGRRWIGLLVVVAALLAAAVAPAVGGRVIPGFAAVGNIAGPPQVGDCLVQQPVQTDAAVGPTGTSVYESLMTAPCAGRRFGEVVAVIADGLAIGRVEIADDDGVISYDDPNVHTCTAALGHYLLAGPSGVAWNPSISFAATLVKPTALQVRFGQTWVACVGFASGPGGVVTAYDGSLRTSTTPALLPASAASSAICLSSVNFFLQHRVDCDLPHPVESVAMLLTDDPSTAAAGLNSRCRKLGGTYSGMSDPTAGGQLTTSAVAVHRASDGTQAPGLVTSDVSGYARCVITAEGSRLLNASLAGLGDGPVPWAES